MAEAKKNRVSGFFKDLKSEMKKIVWSPKQDVCKNTLVVIVVVAVVSLVIAGLDFGFTKLLELLLALFN